METLGECLVRLRKQRGWSQEFLSDKAGIHLRTLQRMEKGETFPRGNTLKMLCDALEVPIDELVDYGKKEDRNFLMWYQLSAMAGLIIPLGSVLLPLILWLAKRDQIAKLQEQGINVINFQLLTTVVCYLFQIIWMIISAVKFVRPMANDVVPDVTFFISGATLVLGVNIAFRLVFYLLWPVIAAYRTWKDDPVRFYYPRLITIIR